MSRLPRDRSIAAAALLVAAYAALRSADAADAAVLVWTALAAGFALLSPVGAIVLVACIAPFVEAASEAAVPTAAPVLVAAAVASVLMRVAGPWRWVMRGWGRPASVALLVSLLLMAGAAMAILVTLGRLGAEPAIAAVRYWSVGIGAGMALLVTTAVLVRATDAPVHLAVMAAAAAAAFVSLADHATRGGVDASALGWLVRPVEGYVRLSGVIPAPNAAAAIFLVPTVAFAAFSLFGPPGSGGRSGRPSRRRLASGLLAVGLLAVVLLTYSRSALLALVVVATLFAWRVRAAAAMVAAIGTFLVAVLLLPAAFQVRGWVFLGDGGVTTGGDDLRLRAWAAAVRMFLDAPLVGQGAQSFEIIRRSFGSGPIGAPHNEWLRLFAEGGIVLGVVGLSFLAAVVWALLRDRSWTSTAALGTFCAFVVMASFNNPFTYLQVMAPVFVMVGAGLGLVARRADARRPEPASAMALAPMTPTGTAAGPG